MFGAIFSGKSAPEIVVWRPLHFVRAPNPHPLPSSVVREDEPLLVASARAGDAAAFEELVARYEDKIFRLTSNITGNREDAEDAMQDAFLKAFALYAKSEIDNIVSAFVEQLEDEYRIVLVLRDVEELSTQETADALGISISAVKSRLLRARLKLREKLSRHFRQGAPN